MRCDKTVVVSTQLKPSPISLSPLTRRPSTMINDILSHKRIPCVRGVRSGAALSLHTALYGVGGGGCSPESLQSKDGVLGKMGGRRGWEEWDRTRIKACCPSHNSLPQPRSVFGSLLSPERQYRVSEGV